VAAIITLKYIEEAINNLNYKSETTLKSKLINAVRKFYRDENSIETVKSIDTEDLVRLVWDTGDNPELIKTKKKNFSSIKSSVNSDLKKLYAEGKNTLGIIIGHNNAFDISDEAKNKTLSGIADIFKEKGIDDSSKIAEIIAALSDMLTGAMSSVSADEAHKEIDRLKNLVGTLSGKLGLNVAEDNAVSAVPDEQTIPVKNITEVLSEKVHSKTLAEIIDILRDGNIHAADKTNKIMATVKEMLATAISSAGPELPSEEAGQIKDFVSGLSGMTSEGKSTGDTIELPEQSVIAEDEIIEEVEESAVEELVEVIEEPADALTSPEAGLAVEEMEISVTGNDNVEEIMPDGEMGDVTINGYDTTKEALKSPADNSILPPLENLPKEVAVEDSLSEETALADDDSVETAEALPEDFAIEETIPEDNAEEFEELGPYEEITGDEVEEVILEDVADNEDMRISAELLAELSAAAKALEKIGPDLTSGVYSEEEIKAKAKILSAEFDRYLTFREKFYNQHILIKSGSYPVGGNEAPPQTVSLREFYIGKFPVTNALFEIFVEKTGYITTAEKYGFGIVYIPRMQKVKNSLTGTESFIWNNQLQHKKVPGACWYHPHGPASTLYIKRTHPVVQVSLEDACAFAAWTGKRIPTEKEWEAAARTSRGYLYPWGNNWREDACNMEKSLLGDTSPVDQYVKFSNEYEVADTLGNVLEWTLDPWQTIKPGEEEDDGYVIKGSSWISDSPISLTDRRPFYKNACSNILGFRCIAI